MEKKIEFFKLQASGNDFILISNFKFQISNFKLKELAKKVCQRKFGIGADGLLVIEPSKKADFKMRIFNPDGSEAEMCGNGARCGALWAGLEVKDLRNKEINFETRAGIIKAKVLRKETSSQVRVRMANISSPKLDLLLKLGKRILRVNYIDTGVPHTVIFVEGLDKIDIVNTGRKIRFHKFFLPRGTNVDFVEVLEKDFLKVRTYERGVEAETLACGTGAVASAIIASYKLKAQSSKYRLRVLTKSGEILKVYFQKEEGSIKDVWLEGKAYLVYKGELAHSKNAKRKEQSA